MNTSLPRIAELTSPQFAELLRGSEPVVVLQPVGSVEPHGPHMALSVDTVISEGAAQSAAARLQAAGLVPLLAPAIPYGVTDCAAGFAGAISVSARALTSFLGAVITGYLDAGVRHVCLINNHLEPDHDRAVRDALTGIDGRAASVACPLTRRWARTLSPEFKSGKCHAGQYETSIMMARAPELVDESVSASLPFVDVSLSEKLAAGVETFAAMGMDHAYAGDPAKASASEGKELLELLGEMVATTVLDALAADATSE